MKLQGTVLAISLLLILVLIVIVSSCSIDLIRYQNHESQEVGFYYFKEAPMKCNKIIPFNASGGRQEDFLLEQGWSFWERR